MDADCDGVGTCADGVGDVELLGEATSGAPSDLCAVDPYLVPGFDAVKAQDDAALAACVVGLPAVGQLERTAIVPGGVFVGDERRVDWERAVLLPGPGR